ncbi:MAG: ATP-binding protein, partial [Polyangiaceae bacterium]
ETGDISGLFHTVGETTTRMLQERRMHVLRDLLARVSTARSVHDAFELSVATLETAALDLPFALIYEIDERRGEAVLTAHSGLAAGDRGCPRRVSLEGRNEGTWPLAEVVRTKQGCEVTALEHLFGPIASEPYPESPHTAFVLPIIPPGRDAPLALLVVATSPRLPLTEPYRAFIEFLASGITSCVAKARADEEQRARADALAELDRAKTDFFSNVSHEFRTPLTLMLGPLEEELSEREDSLPPDRLERLSTVYRNARRLLKLVNNLLDFSRLESGRVAAQYEPLDLATYTGELVSTFCTAFQKAQLTLSLELKPLAEVTFVDREMWEKIVLNLISNAFKHTFEGGVTVRLRGVGEYVELQVEDTGTGIEPADLPRLFERFHRVRSSRSRTHEGSGIGLALVRELAELLGGSVSATSEPGRGSQFSVRIRRGRDHLPAVQVRESAPPSSAPSPAATQVEECLSWSAEAQPVEQLRSPKLPDGVHASNAELSSDDTSPLKKEPRPRILLVDDNSDMRLYVARLLKDQYAVVTAANGAEAIAEIDRHEPDLVLSDVMMPVLDGFGLLTALRKQVKTRAIPVILLSARADIGASLAPGQDRADDYVVKPFMARELLARVRTHLDLARQRKQWAHELQRANEELEAFNYSVSHDLRTPLRAIDGFSRVILARHAQHLDEEGRGYFERVRKAAARMGELIDDLLRLSGISRQNLKRQNVDLTQLARNVARGLRESEPTREVEFEIQDDLVVDGDARLMRIVLENLLGNSWKFTRPRERARIAVGKVEKSLTPAFYVADNGVGFDPAHTSQLFHAFQRLHSETEFAGTGIGLAIVGRVIEKHGGRIWAEGRVSEGATFSFELMKQC